MEEYVLLTDSSCDMPAEMARDLDISVLPLKVNLEGKEYRNYLDERELPSGRFYARLRDGAMATTSAVNVEEFVMEMEMSLLRGMDILYIGFSSALSATYASGCAAAEELRHRYEDRSVVCVDSKCASMGQGLLVYLAGVMRKNGASFEEVCRFVKETAPHLCHWFTVDDLHFLKRGGRVSAATAVLGSMLQIKPVLHVDDEGRLINVGKAKGRRASIKALFDHMAATGIDLPSQSIFISHGDCIDDAEYLKGLIVDKYHPKDVVISPVGPVIGAHSGPGTLALFFVGSAR